MVLEPLSRVRVTGPHEAFAVGFAGELGVQGYRGQGRHNQGFLSVWDRRAFSHCNRGKGVVHG